MTGDPLTALAARAGQVLLARQRMLIAAESCTGGGIGEAMTRIPGSSRWYAGSVAAYSYEAKTALLGIPVETLERYGAVSREVAELMAAGARERMGHGGNLVSLAVTGIAGPGGGTVEKPVGTVCFAWCINGTCWSDRRHFAGNRAAVRHATIQHALQTLVEALTTSGAAATTSIDAH
jgi:nicotinamide-nucleotide amidase